MHHTLLCGGRLYGAAQRDAFAALLTHHQMATPAWQRGHGDTEWRTKLDRKVHTCWEGHHPEHPPIDALRALDGLSFVWKTTTSTGMMQVWKTVRTPSATTSQHLTGRDIDPANLGLPILQQALHSFHGKPGDAGPLDAPAALTTWLKSRAFFLDAHARLCCARCHTGCNYCPDKRDLNLPLRDALARAPLSQHARLDTLRALRKAGL